MKRVLLSILIGLGSGLITWGFIKYWENNFSRASVDRQQFEANVKIIIGTIDDDEQLIKTTKEKIQMRINHEDFFVNHEDFFVRQIDKNSFEISGKGIADTTYLKKLISESSTFEILEAYTIQDVADAILAAEEELTNRRKLLIASKDSSELLSKQFEVAKAAKGDGIASLTELIKFSDPYDLNGITTYPTIIGSIKKRDAIYLNRIFNDDKIKKIFPTTLKLTYGSVSDGMNRKDSILTIYFLKTQDREMFFYPTADQIVEARMDFDVITGDPMVLFEFNDDGSKAWYHMTRRNIGKPIALVMNDMVISAPVVESAIETGETRITGNFTVEESIYLSRMLKDGKLDLPVAIIESKFTILKKSKPKIWLPLLIFVVFSGIAYFILPLFKPASKP